MGLHAKSLEIGRRSSVVGPANLDPQSALINSGMFAVVDRKSLGSELAEIIERHARTLQSLSEGKNICSIEVLNTAAILNASGKLGSYRPFSIALIVCLVTTNAAARSA
jgi:phosphatidylserine/phosphatidylglycerophosphate/cardiolipin synthase-like enzyme|tara:strand:- start:74 stop:400 length:327 start_codon:yes stop_codon:yes gene_type:complete